MKEHFAAFKKKEHLDHYQTKQNEYKTRTEDYMMPRATKEKKAEDIKRAREEQKGKRLAIKGGRRGTAGNAQNAHAFTVNQSLPAQTMLPTLTQPGHADNEPDNDDDDDVDDDDMNDPDEKFFVPKMKVMLDAQHLLGDWKSLHTIVDLDRGKTMIMLPTVNELHLSTKTLSQQGRPLHKKCKLGKVEVIGTVDIVVRLQNDGELPGRPVTLKDCFVLSSKAKDPRNSIFLSLTDALKIRTLTDASTGKRHIAPALHGYILTIVDEVSQEPVPDAAGFMAPLGYDTSTPVIQRLSPGQAGQAAAPAYATAQLYYNNINPAYTTGPYMSRPYFSGHNAPGPSPTLDSSWSPANMPVNSYGSMDMAIPDSNATTQPLATHNYLQLPTGQDFLNPSNIQNWEPSSPRHQPPSSQ